MPLPLILLIALQAPGQKPAQPAEDPPAYIPVPVSASPDLARLVYRIQDALAAKDFDKAAALNNFLPTTQIELGWDASKVPAASRPAYAAARDAAIDEFRKAFPNFTIQVVSKSKRLQIDFEPVLAIPPGSVVPAGETFFYSEEPGSPWLEGVIGLKRGNPLVPTNSNDIFNDVCRALGTAAGLATTPFYGGVMTGSDLPTTTHYGFASAQRFLVRGITKLADNLRMLTAKKISLPSGKPSLFVQTESVAAGEAFQGDVMPISVQITNNGDAPLSYSARGDCGCIGVSEENVLNPGQTWIIRGVVDTNDVRGAISHHIELMTNDPDHPGYAIPVTATIKPRYDLIPQYPDGLTADDTGAAKFGVTLKFSPGAKPFSVLQSAVIGVKGQVTQKELRDGAGGITGYQFDVDLPKVDKGGPWTAELNLLTDDENLRILRYPEHIVNGIITLPTTLFLGTALQGPKDFRLDVVAPGLTFKIKSVTSSLAGIHPSVSAIKGIGYRIKVSYDGTFPAGPFDGSLTIETDNPKQPHFEIPISGTAKG